MLSKKKYTERGNLPISIAIPKDATEEERKYYYGIQVSKILERMKTRVLTKEDINKLIIQFDRISAMDDLVEGVREYNKKMVSLRRPESMILMAINDEIVNPLSDEEIEKCPKMFPNEHPKIFPKERIDLELKRKKHREYNRIYMEKLRIKKGLPPRHIHKVDLELRRKKKREYMKRYRDKVKLLPKKEVSIELKELKRKQNRESAKRFREKMKMKNMEDNMKKVKKKEGKIIPFDKIKEAVAMREVESKPVEVPALTNFEKRIVELENKVETLLMRKETDVHKDDFKEIFDFLNSMIKEIELLKDKTKDIELMKDNLDKNNKDIKNLIDISGKIIKMVNEQLSVGEE